MYALLSHHSSLPNIEDRLRALFGPLQNSCAFTGAHLILLPNSAAFNTLAASLRRLARETGQFSYVFLGPSPELFDVVLPPSHPVNAAEIPPSLATANLAYWHAFGPDR